MAKPVEHLKAWLPWILLLMLLGAVLADVRQVRSTDTLVGAQIYRVRDGTVFGKVIRLSAPHQYEEGGLVAIVRLNDDTWLDDENGRFAARLPVSMIDRFGRIGLGGYEFKGIRYSDYSFYTPLSARTRLLWFSTLFTLLWLLRRGRRRIVGGQKV